MPPDFSMKTHRLTSALDDDARSIYMWVRAKLDLIMIVPDVIVPDVSVAPAVTERRRGKAETAYARSLFCEMHIAGEHKSVAETTLIIHTEGLFHLFTNSAINEDSARGWIKKHKAQLVAVEVQAGQPAKKQKTGP